MVCGVWDVDLGDDFCIGFLIDVLMVIVYGDWDISMLYDNVFEFVLVFLCGKFVMVVGGLYGVLCEVYEEGEGFCEVLFMFLCIGNFDVLLE